MWRAISFAVLILVAFCALLILSMLIVYAACQLLIAVGLEGGVFEVWLVGVPIGFVAAVIATIRLGRALKL